MRKFNFEWLNGPAFGRLALITFMMLHCAGCRKSRPSIQEAIVQAIHRCPDPNSCRLKISELTPFKWEKAYAFYHASKSERSALLKTEDTGFQESVHQLVFLDRGKIVAQENEPTDLEAAEKEEVLFQCPEGAIVVATFEHNAEFRVNSKVGPNGIYYELTEIK